MNISVKIRHIHMSRRLAPCPTCGLLSKRHSNAHRRLREIGITCPTVVAVTYSKHYCERCKKYFSVDMRYLAPSTGRYTDRVRRTAVSMVIKKALTLEKAASQMEQQYHVHIPLSTLHDWIMAELTAA